MIDFKENANDDEIKKLILRTNPIISENLDLKVEAGLSHVFDDFSLEYYCFYFKNKSNEENCIQLTSYIDDLSDVLNFLCDLIEIKSSICTFIDDEGETGIFYAKSLNDKQIHFVVADDYELYKNFCKNDVDYSFEDAHICLDIIIDKYKLIKQFYYKIWEQTQNNKDVKFNYFLKNIQNKYIESFDKLKKYCLYGKDTETRI